MVIEEGKPIFLQIKEQIENEIIDGSLAEESQVPSTNEFAAFHRINPATAGKGVNLLVDEGVLYKKRGIGMFVATGAREKLVSARRTQFVDDYVRPLLTEAAKLGIDAAALERLIGQAAASTPAAGRAATSNQTTSEPGQPGSAPQDKASA